jgi:uracil-DNA glycosylase
LGITLLKTLKEVRACTLCKDDLELGPRPVLQIHKEARVLISGQAPGIKVHLSGVPFDDASGERLRSWMGIERDVFYDATKIAILPMGFCYPGKGTSGDLPPLKRCAATWREKLLAQLPNIKLNLVIGLYAQQWHFLRPDLNLTDTVKRWHEFGDEVLPLPHPSPRNNIWLKKNAWFETDVMPELKNRVSQALR